MMETGKGPYAHAKKSNVSASDGGKLKLVTGPYTLDPRSKDGKGAYSVAEDVGESTMGLTRGAHAVGERGPSLAPFKGETGLMASGRDLDVSP